MRIFQVSVNMHHLKATEHFSPPFSWMSPQCNGAANQKETPNVNEPQRPIEPPRRPSKRPGSCACWIWGDQIHGKYVQKIMVTGHLKDVLFFWCFFLRKHTHKARKRLGQVNGYSWCFGVWLFDAVFFWEYTRKHIPLKGKLRKSWTQKYPFLRGILYVS